MQKYFYSLAEVGNINKDNMQHVNRLDQTDQGSIIISVCTVSCVKFRLSDVKCHLSPHAGEEVKLKCWLWIQTSEEVFTSNLLRSDDSV